MTVLPVTLPNKDSYRGTMGRGPHADRGLCRTNPTRGLSSAGGRGIYQRSAAIFRIFGVFVHLLLLALKPALLIYGASKLYQIAKEPE
jgi:hypothetical protein